MPFPKTYRTNAGWALSIGAILALFSNLRNEERAVISLAVIGALGFLWSAWEHEWIRLNGKSVPQIIAILGGFSLIAWFAWPPKPMLLPTPGPQVQPIAVFAKCDMIGLPIEIPPHDAIRVIPINEKGMKSANWGSLEILNDTKKTEQWPDKAKVQQAARQHDAGLFAYKCEVSNHASSNLFDVAMPMRFWFGNKAGEENAIRYAPVISPLDAGHSFVLYFVNDCPIVATGLLPDYATVLVAGEAIRRNTKLNLPNRNPADRIMFWFPTKIRWINWTQCE